jgi:hypothetical protein
MIIRPHNYSTRYTIKIIICKVGYRQPLYVIDISTGVTNKNIQTSAAIVISSLLAIAASIPGLTTFEAFGQQPNATNTTATISNQTGASDNQTMGVLTQEDFNTLTDNLNAARESIQENDPAGAVGELGSAETELIPL